METCILVKLLLLKSSSSFTAISPCEAETQLESACYVLLRMRRGLEFFGMADGKSAACRAGVEMQSLKQL